MRQIAEALDAAHDHGLVHRDIKPANIILSRFGKRTDVVKVLDFGLVREIDRDEKLTAENVISGTPGYLAPETLTKPDDVGPAVDIYAFGAVGFFLLAGQTPFTGKTFAEICAHHIHTPAPAPSDRADGAIPEELDDIVTRCLAKDPVGRYPSAAAIVEALDALDLPSDWDRATATAWWDDFDKRGRRGHEVDRRDPSRRTVNVQTRC